MKKHITSKAFFLFSDWVTNARKVYPDLNYDIKDPSILETDLEEAVNKAISSLKKVKAKKRALPGFDYEYLCEFITERLNRLWHNEYIKKQSNDHKMYSALKVLSDCLEYDEELCSKLTAIYTEHYKSEVNLDNPDTEIEVNLPKVMDFLELVNPSPPIITALGNMSFRLTEKIFEGVAPNFLPDIQEHISVKDFEDLISHPA